MACHHLMHELLVAAEEEAQDMVEEEALEVLFKQPLIQLQVRLQISILLLVQVERALLEHQLAM